MIGWMIFRINDDFSPRYLKWSSKMDDFPSSLFFRQLPVIQANREFYRMDSIESTELNSLKFREMNW